MDDEFASDESNPIRSVIVTKFDNDLYDEENNIANLLIRARRIKLPKNGEDWEIYENKKRIMTLKGIRFNKKEKDFLRSINGIKFLINEYKNGCKSVAQFKNKLKEIL